MRRAKSRFVDRHSTVARRTNWNTRWPLRTFHHGADVLYDYARAHGDKQLRLLTVVRSGQWVFHEVIGS
jgi:hypothetical protein